MSGAADFFVNLQSNLKRLNKDIAREVVKVEADRFHKENFAKRGFTNKGFQKWASRANNIDPSRALLVGKGSGHLKRKATHGKNKGKSIDYVLPIYGRVHNEGLRAGRGKGFKMPKRQFIGHSKVLEKRIRDKAIRLLNERLNRL